MGFMKRYKVIILDTAEEDLMNLSLFLFNVMSIEGAWKYHQCMLHEIQSLSILADIFPLSPHLDIQRYHPLARHMVSHNKRWVYIFHIDNDTVLVDRIIPAKLITK